MFTEQKGVRFRNCPAGTKVTAASKNTIMFSGGYFLKEENRQTTEHVHNKPKPTKGSPLSGEFNRVM